MNCCSEIKKKQIVSKICCFLISILFLSLHLLGQETNSNVSGIVKSERKELLQKATVIAVHEPTKNTYSTQTNEKGYFYFFNLKPGGPYTLRISYTGFEELKKTDLYLSYSSQNSFTSIQENDFHEFILRQKDNSLQEITVVGKKSESKIGTETNISSQQINSLPSISRNLQDYIRMVPHARVNAEGGISLAGQNTKFNAFFIDGANNNDMLGLAQSGINGGQTASPPLSIEAIEEINVLQAPYDVQYGNFTGGSVNVITRSGSNRSRSSAWCFFRNEQMAAKSPQALDVSGSPGVSKRQRLSPFFNQTTGLWVSGPIVKNKLFYFLLAEKQAEQQPQPFNFADYRGNSAKSQISAFADTLMIRYGYDPGSFLETRNDLDATRINIRFDWNPSDKNKLSLSYRYNNAQRTTGPTAGSTFIRFSNNQFRLRAETHTSSLEWKAYVNPKISNRFLFTYTHHVDDRDFIGKPFPAIQITDGAGTITAGSAGTSHMNLFKGSDLTIRNVTRYIANKQVITTGIEFDHSKINDLALGNFFGQYQFRTMGDFFNSFPSRFIRTVSLIDNPVEDKTTNAGTKYSTQRFGFFISDDIQPNARLKLTAGLRIDGNVLPRSFNVDDFFTITARPEIEKHYDIEDAQPGQLMNTHWQLSPRLGFYYRIPEERLTIYGGAGLFTGHIINVWATEFYNVNNFQIDVFPQLYNIRFIPDPYAQPGLQTINSTPDAARGNISIVSKNFKYPVVFRTSLGTNKQLKDGWSFSMEFLYTKNVHEHKYTNVNLLPPSLKTPLPDRRNVYSLNTIPARIPMNGGNPYNNIILLSNNKHQRGFSYSLSAVINKTVNDRLMITAAYNYGSAVALFEPNGSANTNSAQWGGMKSVNGKNYAAITTSDFDPGHRFYASISKKIVYSKNKKNTIVTMFYNGQSGSPYNYVYGGSMINDNGRNSNTDLIYIPTNAELDVMNFIPYTNSGNITFSPTDQKRLLSQFIDSDRYLRKHRGQFAERNGARLPFTHVIDLRIQQDLKFKIKRKEWRVSLIYDVFNFTNMLNRHLGRTYSLGSDSYQVIRFIGFANSSTLTPDYQFIPIDGKPWSIQSSTAPGNSARWISQLGARINMD